MADKIIENNQVSIMGQIISPFTFSHQVFGEGFYLTDVLVKRLSDSEDRIPVMISERLIDVTQDYEGSTSRFTASSAPTTGMKKKEPAGSVRVRQRSELCGGRR